MRRNRSERGSAMILAVLILFAMLGLGIVAMRTTKQNLSGSGNLRMNKQARYVAELGLYHAISLMQKEGQNILAKRNPSMTSTLEIESGGRIVERLQNKQEGAIINGTKPKLFDGAPEALGSFGTGSGYVPSYRVVVDGFTKGPPRPGNEDSPTEIFCLMHFTSTGYIAGTVLPTAEQFNAEGSERYAEHTIKAAVVLGPFSTASCARL